MRGSNRPAQASADQAIQADSQLRETLSGLQSAVQRLNVASDKVNDPRIGPLSN
jgi:hypothetical protein